MMNCCCCWFPTFSSSQSFADHPLSLAACQARRSESLQEMVSEAQNRGHWGVAMSVVQIWVWTWKCWVNIPNEIAIFHRDNDQQNHWVQWGLAYFQTNPYQKISGQTVTHGWKLSELKLNGALVRWEHHQSWLVVWNICYFFHILGIIIPTDYNDIFQRGGEKPPTRKYSWGISSKPWGEFLGQEPGPSENHDALLYDGTPRKRGACPEAGRTVHHASHKNWQTGIEPLILF